MIAFLEFSLSPVLYNEEELRHPPMKADLFFFFLMMTKGNCTKKNQFRLWPDLSISVRLLRPTTVGSGASFLWL